MSRIYKPRIKGNEYAHNGPRCGRCGALAERHICMSEQMARLIREAIENRIEAPKWPWNENPEEPFINTMRKKK